MNESTNLPLGQEGADNSIDFTSPLSPLPGESPAAHEAFLYYFETPLPRSLRKTAEAFGGAEGTFFEWSTKYHWQKRIHAYRVILANRRMQADLNRAEQPITPAPLSDQVPGDKPRVVGHRLMDRGEVLLEETLMQKGEKLSVKDAISVILAGEQLSRPRRYSRTSNSSVNPNSGLRQELMTVAQLAREDRPKIQEPPHTSEPSSSPLTGPSESKQ